MDDLKLTPHPIRKGPNEGAWYGDICMVGNTAYLIIAERSPARLAAVTGDTTMAARRRKRIEKAVKAMRDHMWDEKAATFLAVGWVGILGIQIGLAARVIIRYLPRLVNKRKAAPDREETDREDTAAGTEGASL